MAKNKTVKKVPVGKLIKRDRYLILMVAPCVLYFLIFHYAPMVWNIVAFQDYNVRRGILGSSWIGLENFKSLCFPFNKEYVSIKFYGLAHGISGSDSFCASLK